jgi:hypothetical protein
MGLRGRCCKGRMMALARRGELGAMAPIVAKLFRHSE